MNANDQARAEYEAALDYDSRRDCFGCWQNSGTEVIAGHVYCPPCEAAGFPEAYAKTFAGALEQLHATAAELGFTDIVDRIDSKRKEMQQIAAQAIRRYLNS